MVYKTYLVKSFSVNKTPGNIHIYIFTTNFKQFVKLTYKIHSNNKRMVERNNVHLAICSFKHSVGTGQKIISTLTCYITHRFVENISIPTIMYTNRPSIARNF